MRNTYAFLTHCLFICGIVYIFQINPTSAQIATPIPATTPTVTPTSTPILPNPIAVTTGEAANVTSNSATLNGRGNGRGLTTVWFEYGTVSVSYKNTSLTQNVSGSPFDIPISIDITGLRDCQIIKYTTIA